jgi:Tol biopolymer transport system component
MHKTTMRLAVLPILALALLACATPQRPVTGTPPSPASHLPAVATPAPSPLPPALPGVQADGSSSEPSLSADGRYVAFASAAGNLIAGDNPGVLRYSGSQIYVRDRQAGMTERVSVGIDGAPANGHCANPVLSADGRYVAYASAASNLMAGDVTYRAVLSVYVYDRLAHRTERVSSAPDGSWSDQPSAGWPALSADGRYVVFSSSATNLLPGVTVAAHQVYLYDREAKRLELVSASADDASTARGANCACGVSADGRWVAFLSSGADAQGNYRTDVYLRDRQTGQTTCVTAAQAHGGGNLAISADGQWLALLGKPGTPAPADSQGRWFTAFVLDRSGQSAVPVAPVTMGGEGFFAALPFLSLSADGRYLAFASSAPDLLPGGAAGDWSDVYVYDRVAARLERVAARAGWVAISADGRFVAFASDASDLVADDTNGQRDVFVFDRGTGQTERVSLGNAVQE